MFSRKQYQEIADIIRYNTHKSKDVSYHNAYIDCDIVDDLCDLFKKDNPNFDADKFRKACER